MQKLVFDFEMKKKLDSIIPIGRTDGELVFQLYSPLHLKTKWIKVQTPLEVTLYDALYQRTRVQHIVFTTRGNQPAICSILKRDDLKDDIMTLAGAGWLPPQDSYRLYRRLFRKEGCQINTKQFNLQYGDYPFARSP